MTEKKKRNVLVSEGISARIVPTAKEWKAVREAHAAYHITRLAVPEGVKGGLLRTPGDTADKILGRVSGDYGTKEGVARYHALAGLLYALAKEAGPLFADHLPFQLKAARLKKRFMSETATARDDRDHAIAIAQAKFAEVEAGPRSLYGEAIRGLMARTLKVEKQ